MWIPTHSYLFNIIRQSSRDFVQKWEKTAKTYLAPVATASPTVIKTWETWGWLLFSLIPKLRIIPKLG